MKLSKKTFYDKVLGCWMGKNIGGTLGAPVEFRRQFNDFIFYTHDLNGEPLPNDDLDLQLIWLKCVEDYGINITARELAEYWLAYQVANYSEYGIAKTNLKAGFMPPLSGIIGNEYKDSNGAFIRSEIWACMCPGRPDLAVQYAYEDAIVDHGNGEGVYGAMWTAAMESAAFVESDLRKLVEIGKSYIPSDCGVVKAIDTAIECYDKGMDWKDTRDLLMEKFRGAVLFNVAELCSDRDREKGFDKGPIGYDNPLNMAFIVAGMLYGEGDFEKVLCTTVNMGEDTDCTAGTAGSIFGIIYGYSNIPQKWVDPIGHSIQTICCNKSQGQLFPKTVEELTERTIKQTQMVSSFYDKKWDMKTMDVSGDEDDLSDVNYSRLYAENHPLYRCFDLMRPMNGPRYDHIMFSAALDYEETYIEPEGESVKITLLLGSKQWEGNELFNFKVEFISDDLTADKNEVLVPVWQRQVRPIERVEFNMTADYSKSVYEGTFKITCPGRHTCLYVPVTLQSYNRPTDKEYMAKYGKI